MTSPDDLTDTSRTELDSPALLPLLLAFVRGSTRFDARNMPQRVLDAAIDAGLGPILAHVISQSAAKYAGPAADLIESADLTARVLSAELFDCIEEVIASANAVGCQPILLKGGAMAIQYYPQRHLRMMGDLDLLVPREDLRAVEDQLRSLGCGQPTDPPESRYAHHHHSKPFFHPGRGVWIEAHTRPFPPNSPLLVNPAWTLDSIFQRTVPVTVGACTVHVLGPEAQLIYTAVRWAERLNPERGAFPLLDAALLIRSHPRLDWEGICLTVDKSWAAAALYLMLSYLHRWQFAAIPADVLATLAASNRFIDPMSRWILHRLVTALVLDGRKPGAILRRRIVRDSWGTLVGPGSAWTKFPALVLKVAFPSHWRPSRD